MPTIPFVLTPQSVALTTAEIMVIARALRAFSKAELDAGRTAGYVEADRILQIIEGSKGRDLVARFNLVEGGYVDVNPQKVRTLTSDLGGSLGATIIGMDDGESVTVVEPQNVVAADLQGEGAWRRKLVDEAKAG